MTITVPRGYEIEPGQDVDKELRRPDGVVRLVRRPFLTRLRNHYRAYRAVGLSRWQAFRGAMELAII